MPKPYNPMLLCDWYKVSHRAQYPEGTETVFSTWIPRSSMLPGVDHVVAFGFQAFIKEYLIDYFQANFFDRPKAAVLAEYARIVRYALGDENPDTSHLSDLHDLGFLPIGICAVPEGTLVPLRVPMLTIENTDPKFFWLTNALETLFSCEVWQSITSATIAHEFRKTLDKWAIKTTGSTDGVEFQGHDFSMRGMVKVGGAAASGAGHLLSFSGSDTIPAILFAEEFYNANVETELVGTSIPATEHTVMCSNGQDERATLDRLLTKVYPSGLFSAVCDTWDLFKVITDVLPTLKQTILGRDGKLVIRPDSGDPADIICGTHRQDGTATVGTTPEEKGVIELLWGIFGGTVNELGYKVLDTHIGAIYGDSITRDRAEDILYRLAAKGFASTNVVLGIGSYSYQHTTRDTFGFKLGATWVRINGEERNIFKDPATDTKKTKKSLTGRVAVLHDDDGKLHVVDGLSAGSNEEMASALLPVFRDGRLLWDDSFANIRARLARQ